MNTRSLSFPPCPGRFLLRCSRPGLVAILFTTLLCSEVRSNEPARCVLVEVYFRSDDKDRDNAVAAVEKLKGDRGGLTLVMRDVDRDAGSRERLSRILDYLKLPRDTSPVIYGCNRIVHDVGPETTWSGQLQQMLQLEVFVRTGCSRCGSAKQWLPAFRNEYPALELVYRDIATDNASATRLTRLVEQHRTTAASVPVFHVCNKLLVGYDTPETTGERLRTILKKWTIECPAAPDSTKKGVDRPQKPQPPEKHSSLQFLVPGSTLALHTLLLGNSDPPLPDFQLPADEVPPSAEELELPDSIDDANKTEQADDNINLPVFGRLSASRLGMPLFTIAVGLVDGFNPCAMWVLLFLLSILVNLKDRRRILAIAGTFVVVSGLAYFAFMAAWLNVFLLVGYLRPIQITLAIAAIVIGSVHIKDYFAFKQGFSFSIPESAKPGIYARVRRIVTAQHLTAAILGAIGLAVLVNIIELLCTAGLPALYTNILMQQTDSISVSYAYLSLYILAYMFDDGLMVAAVVLTLNKTRLQESHGRWLKLISGSAILLLGMIMLFRPEWLH